jgi:hypothetical protein
VTDPRQKSRASKKKKSSATAQRTTGHVERSATQGERFGREQMARLGDALASDGMIVFMLLVVLIEATALVIWHRTTGKGPDPIELMSFMGAGGSLMSAMFFVKRIKKSALPFATALLSALVFHIWHMALLWAR